MGIHALDNLSHLAHQDNEPHVEGHYDYDEYVIYEKQGPWGAPVALPLRFSESRDAWERARKRFLLLFNDRKLPVILMGRVFN